MQAPDGSSPGGRAALLCLSTDLKLHPAIVAAALEYAFDYQHIFPSASQALCFGIVRQGHCANMQILDVALQRLTKTFEGLFDTLAVEHISVGQWPAQPSAHDHRQSPHSVQAASTPGNAMRRSVASFTPSARLIASWPVPQQRRSTLSSKMPSSSTSSHSSNAHDLSSVIDATKFRCNYASKQCVSLSISAASPVLASLNLRTSAGRDEVYRKAADSMCM
ncbi:uncharacterized protein M421DRAFT_95312 [Didymella exigua CBS 183.55]|uniref:Uncharacterized protein n=1 Tax=Didymella exigua CBS 183.55 TaxID=1150837 RepID=A0A6A5R9X3_9PLEO|nr:uncharacterized protein M421DRAFT_95312 [Didymella exigua CBS 183.55]KAF1924542.1 hypothetical protein M421DRAFT_95312 [Didymella exigua CBS 183.55]